MKTILSFAAKMWLAKFVFWTVLMALIGTVVFGGMMLWDLITTGEYFFSAKLFFLSPPGFGLLVAMVFTPYNLWYLRKCAKKNGISLASLLQSVTRETGRTAFFKLALWDEHANPTTSPENPNA